MALIGQRGAQAYARGYEDYQRGEHRNRFEHFAAHRGRDVLMGWWRAGYDDARANRPRRYGGDNACTD